MTLRATHGDLEEMGEHLRRTRGFVLVPWTVLCVFCRVELLKTYTPSVFADPHTSFGVCPSCYEKEEKAAPFNEWDIFYRQGQRPYHRIKYEDEKADLRMYEDSQKKEDTDG